MAEIGGRVGGQTMEGEGISGGSLIVVGLGITLGSHLTPIARAAIEGADVVFVAASHRLVEDWVRGMHRDVRSLQPHYAEGHSRLESYRTMVAAMLDEVRAGRRVCGAFYGHPGVFAWVPHRAVAEARAAGFEAVMEPGVSAEDCLYADLGIDPGTHGCVHHEATRWMIEVRPVDTAALLVLWQVGLAGDLSMSVAPSARSRRQLLVDKLLAHYPAGHPVVLYEAAVLPVERHRATTVPLAALADFPFDQHATLVVPPLGPPAVDRKTRAALLAVCG